MCSSVCVCVARAHNKTHMRLAVLVTLKDNNAVFLFLAPENVISHSHAGCCLKIFTGAADWAQVFSHRGRKRIHQEEEQQQRERRHQQMVD